MRCSEPELELEPEPEPEPEPGPEPEPPERALTKHVQSTVLSEKLPNYVFKFENTLSRLRTLNH